MEQEVCVYDEHVPKKKRSRESGNGRGPRRAVVGEGHVPGRSGGGVGGRERERDQVGELQNRIRKYRAEPGPFHLVSVTTELESANGSHSDGRCRHVGAATGSYEVAGNELPARIGRRKAEPPSGS